MIKTVWEKRIMKSVFRLLLAAGIASALCAGMLEAQEKKPPELSAGEMAAVGKFITLKVHDVRQAIARHDYDYAVRLIDAILLLDPGTPFKNELGKLRIKASQEKLQQEVVRVYLFCPKSVHSIGDKIKVTLRIRNVSSGKITFPHEAEKARNFGVLVRKTCDYELLGSTRMRRTQLTLKQDSPIVLEKGQVWEKTFTIDTSHIESIHPIMRRYVLQAVMRPVEIVAGDERSSRYLATGELELFVMPPEHAKLAKEAMQHIMEAAAFLTGKPIPGELAIDEARGAQVALFYSSFFLSEKERPQAAGELMRALEESSGDTAHVIMGSLSFITGEEFGTARDDWLNWWKKQSGK